MRLICTFCAEGMEFPCKESIPVPLTEQDKCVWMNPFRMDGLKLQSELTVKFSILTKEKHKVDMFYIHLQLKHLSFSKHIYSNKNKRNSVHNVSKYVSPTDNVNSIQIDDVVISYTADRFNDLIRLRITSLLANITPEYIQRFTGRTRIRLTAKINGRDVYKATSVYLTDNNSKLFSWIFDPNSEHNDIHRISGPGEYDCDLDKSDENNTTRVRPIIVTENLSIIFIRDVFFPTKTGFSPKYLTVNLKRIDFEAAIKRHKNTQLNIYDNSFVLERGLRLGILLRTTFDEKYEITQMELLIDDYRQTVEEYFSEE